MSRSVAASVTSTALGSIEQPLRVAFVGAEVWLDGCTPPAPARGLWPARFAPVGTRDLEAALPAIAAFRPHVSVVFDPLSLSAEVLGVLPGLTLGILVAGTSEADDAQALDGLDRLLSFDPSLTGTRVGDCEVWRAIPPPVSDALFGEVRPLIHSPRAMTIGRSSPHREAILMPVKHHHDLLQVIHGVSGQALVELLGEYDVGVYVAREPGGRFGQQVGLHLAAGQLLLTESLTPAHGLEREIDYLQFESTEGLMWMLDRLGRFPAMHQRVRVRGRLKAEQYRASRVFARVLHDLLADVAAFGPGHGEAA